jgi:hypothetical protein
MTLTVGDTLWYVNLENQRHMSSEDRGYPVKVLSVGRKWAYLEPAYYGRIDKDTLLADGRGYSTDARCYADQKAYWAACRRDKVWRAFYRAVRNERPGEASEEAIRQAAAVLNISLED